MIARNVFEILLIVIIIVAIVAIYWKLKRKIDDAEATLVIRKRQNIKDKIE